MKINKELQVVINTYKYESYIVLKFRESSDVKNVFVWSRVICRPLQQSTAN